MKRNSRADVIETASRLFAKKGFHGTSMRDLGGELGLLGSSLYSHIGSKNELLVDVVRQSAATFQKLADEVSASVEPAPARMFQLVRGHLNMLVNDQYQAQTFLNETRFLPPNEREMAVKLFDHYQQTFHKVISDGQDAGFYRKSMDVHLAANLILSLLNGTTRWFRDNGPLDIGDVSAEIAALLGSGLSSNKSIEGL